VWLSAGGNQMVVRLRTQSAHELGHTRSHPENPLGRKPERCSALPQASKLCRTQPHSAAICRTLPHSAALCCTLLHSAAICCNLLQSAALGQSVAWQHTQSTGTVALSHRTEARAASSRQPSCSSLAPTVPAARRPPRLPPPSRMHSPRFAPGRSPRPVRAACPTRSRDDSGTRARPSPRPRHNKSWPKAARQRRDAHRSGRGSAHPPSVDCLHAGRACELSNVRAVRHDQRPTPIRRDKRAPTATPHIRVGV